MGAPGLQSWLGWSQREKFLSPSSFRILLTVSRQMIFGLFHDTATHLLILLFNVLLWVLLLWDTESREEEFPLQQEARDKSWRKQMQERGRKKAHFGEQMNELEWFVLDCLLWEGPCAGAGKECKGFLPLWQRQWVISWSQPAFPIPVKEFSVDHLERITFHGSQEALFCKAFPQHNAFDTQIALLLAMWQLVWARVSAPHHWDLYQGIGKSIRNLWKTSRTFPAHITERQERFI